MLLDQLKTATRPHHTRLESLTGLPNTLPAYRQQLQHFFGFIEPWERRLRAQLAPGDFLLERSGRTAWLEEDLLALGSNRAELSTLPRCTDLPPVESRVELFGAAYVLEGSTLGGQFITRHLQENLGLGEGPGCRYFSSYGADTPRRWREFREALLGLSSPTHDPLIVRAAEDMFERLEHWFASRLQLA